jgi:hypothetical protein
MPCRPEQKRRQRSAARHLRDCDSVVAVTELAIEHSPTTAPALDVKVDAAGIEPPVADVCCSHGLSIRYLAAQGPFQQATLVV